MTKIIFISILFISNFAFSAANEIDLPPILAEFYMCLDGRDDTGDSQLCRCNNIQDTADKIDRAIEEYTKAPNFTHPSKYRLKRMALRAFTGLELRVRASCFGHNGPISLERIEGRFGEGSIQDAIAEINGHIESIK